MSAPNLKKRFKGALGARSMSVWMLVSQHPKGITFRDILENITPVLEPQQLKFTLKSLSEANYLAFDGVSRWGTWHITDESPIGVALPPWKMSELYEDDDQTPLTPAVQGVPPGVPNSVFSLAAVETSAGCETSAEAVIHWSAPASVDPLPVTEEPVTYGKGELTIGIGVDIDTVHRAQQPQARFSLCSDGVFTIEHGDAEPISLPPSVTREMFRWLDRLGGLDLSHMLEARS